MGSVISGKRIRYAALGLVAILTAAIAVGSLGGTDSDLAGGADGMIRGPEEALAERGGGFLGPEVGVRSVDDSVASAAIPPFGDRIIRTADLTVEVREGAFEPAWNAVSDLAARLGGKVISSGRTIDEPFVERDRERPHQGTITISVPTDRFEEAAKSLRALGEVRSESITSEDVTQEFVDLTSRVRHLRAEEKVLLSLMARSRSVRDTLAVQTRLSEVQSEIEQLTGRLNYIEARTEFSTFRVTLAEPDALAIFREPDDGPSFAKAWETALVGLERMGTAAMIAAIWAAPFAILLWIGLAIVRSRRAAPTQP